MALFRYKARNNRGDAVNGEIEAGSADIVASQLVNSGVTPVDIRKVRENRDFLTELEGLFTNTKPSLEDLILFCRQMYTLSRSGVPILRALTGLGETTKNRALSAAIDRIRHNIEGGHELSVAMGMESAIFNNLIISIIRVGETTGRLDEAFLQLSTYLEMERDTRSRIKMAIRYPSFVIVAIIFAIGIINTLVIPAFARVFSKMKTELPWQTKLLINTSEFTVAYWPYMVGAALLLFFGVRQYISQGQGKYNWDKLKLRMPVMGSLIMRSTLARFSRSFAMAFKSGVPLIQALTVTARAVDNDFVAERVLSMRNSVERGETSPVLPPPPACSRRWYCRCLPWARKPAPSTR